MGSRVWSTGNTRRGSLLGVLVVAGWMSAAPLLTAQQADLILYNGKVVTVDADFSIAQAVAVTGNTISAVGSDADVMKLASPNTTKIDLKGRTVTPGLIDTHRHIHNEAESDYGATWPPEKKKAYPVDWRGVRTKEDVLNQIKLLMNKYQFKSGEWIFFDMQIGFLGLQGGTGEAGRADLAEIMMNELNRHELDKVTPNNPVATSIGIPEFNGFMVNSKGMDILWSKYGDFIKKYGRYWIESGGQPEGKLEAPAARLLLTVLPQPDPPDLATIYKMKNEELNAEGYTTISSRLPKNSAAAYKLLAARGEMTIRMGYGMEWIFGNIPDLEDSMKALQKNIGAGDDQIWVTSIAPTAMDGASTRACTNEKRQTAFGAIDRWWPTGQCNADIEFHGAAGKGAPMSSNYFRDWTMNSGKYGVRFANTHVAGDRSVHLILNMIEQIQKQNGPSATKNWAFDHCTMVNPEDLPRAAKLGVTFSCAPKYVEDLAPAASVSYGEKVANTFVVPVKSMVDNDVRMVFETDRDVYVWHDLQILLERKDTHGHVWGPQEKLDRPTALKSITRWAAEYVLKGDKLGSLEPGKLADIIVLDRDFMTIPSDEVEKIHPQLTVENGKVVYVHPQFAQEYGWKPVGAVIASYEQLMSRRDRPRRGNDPYQP